MERTASDVPSAVVPEQAARLLGVSRDQLYQLVRTRQLRPFALGRRVVFSTAAIADWLARQAARASVQQS